MSSPVGARDFEELAGLIDRTPGKLYWQGDAGPEILDELSALPIALPRPNSYLFHAKGKNLYVVGVDVGISSFKAAGDSPELTTEITKEGVVLTSFGSSKYSRLIICSERQDLPPTAIAVDNLDAPISLLDQYADLKNKQRSGRLSREEEVERTELLKRIKEQYSRGEGSRSRSPSRAYGSRSTPTSSGESRGDSVGRGG